MSLLIAPPHCLAFGAPQKDRNKPTIKDAPESFLPLWLWSQCPLQIEVGLGFEVQELNPPYIRSFDVKLFLMRRFSSKVSSFAFSQL